MTCGMLHASTPHEGTCAATYSDRTKEQGHELGAATQTKHKPSIDQVNVTPKAVPC